MHRFGRLSRSGRLLLALTIGGAVFGIATAVQASIPDASGVIHGCYNTSRAHGTPTGQLRVIDASAPGGTCTSWEAPLNWTTAGPTGPTGATGARGPTGASPAGLAGYGSFILITTQVIPAGGDVDFATSVPGPQAGGIVHVNPASTTQFVFDKSGTYAISISLVPSTNSSVFSLTVNGTAVFGSIITNAAVTGQTIAGRVLVNAVAGDVLTLHNQGNFIAGLQGVAASQPSASIMFEKIA